jgi:hypothetical protein
VHRLILLVISVSVALVARAADSLPSPTVAAASTTDLWGEAALRQSGGPT